jgi:Ni/Fe-hydrogenase subunit HybB-like protein
VADHAQTLPSVAAPQSFRSWFMHKLRMGMSWRDYGRSLVTPFNVFAALVLLIGIPVIASRFVFGLAAVTHASNDYPWGLFLGWGLFGGVPLSATGFVMATAYYIFGFRRYAPMVRIGILTGFLGYLFAVLYLLIDLGRPWRIYFPMTISFGTASVLFLVAWHVALYLTVQLLEFSPAIFEWLNSTRTRGWAKRITIGMTIAGIVLSTLHQSALGAMFLLAPGKVHPLWFSQYLPQLFLASAVYVAMAMVIVVSFLAARFLRERCDEVFLGRLDELTIGLAKACAIAMYVYFIMKIVSVAHDAEWALLATPYGYWFLVEMLGFVLLPALVLTAGYKTSRTGVVRAGAVLAVIGVLVNRLNVSTVTLNYNLPDHLHHIIPPTGELIIVATLTVLHILIFRWIVNRMSVTREDPAFKTH